tara:strand:- start:927 stop:1847 length:921 start_codon:yes stop_codon:yes gene_type:complete
VNIIFIGNRKGKTWTLTLNNWAKFLLSMCLLGLPVSGGIYLGMQLGESKVDDRLMDYMQQELAEQQANLDAGREEARQKVAALTKKLAALQTRLLRLDALGARLANIADLEDGEFDFSLQPAIGGPELESFALEYSHTELDLMFAQLQSHVENREGQLGVLESLMLNRQLNGQSQPAGRPVLKGWLSSRYGRRTDPFSGHRAWHNGIDFAGQEGDQIIAVASGVVTRAGRHSGYGELVEVDHGEGYLTRYAHNRENLVKAGDTVKQGDVIALMGSSGRSTGPHVHFEVYKNGRSVDPASYIRRTIR